MPEPVRAETPGDAFWSLDPFAVVDPSSGYYVDLQQKLGKERYGIEQQIQRRFAKSPNAPRFVQIGVIGHKGSGKTTLVRSALANLPAHEIHPAHVDALAVLDQADFSFADVMLVIANAVLGAVEKADGMVPKEKVELVHSWFAEELLTETHRKELLGSLETDAKASLGLGFIAKLSAKITAVLKSQNEYRQEIRRRAERDPEELVRRVNQLFDAASDALTRMGGAPTLTVVFDNLEKIADRRQVDAAVLRRAEDLRKLRCHLILFLDPADQYAPSTIQPSQAFDVIMVPMLPLRGRTDPADRIDPTVLAVVRDLLDHRLNIARVFADPDACVRRAALYSGGRLRDLFALTRRACELADPDPVTPEHFESAARKLRGERVVAAKPAHWERLAFIHRDKQIANDESDAHLLLHSLVLDYDGDPWWDVHPLVRLDSRFTDAWNRLLAPASSSR